MGSPFADPFGNSFFGHRGGGSSDPFFGGGGFGGFGDDSFPSMGREFQHMQHAMDQPMGGGFASLGNIAKGGDANTESFSSSYSSSSGADGKVHKKSKKQGSETKCHGGICKVTTCADGKCKEVTEKAEDLQKEAARPAKGGAAGAGAFGNMERSMQNEMGHMGDIFKNIRQ